LTTTQHPSAFNVYLRAGWKLVPISSGTKGPNTPLWNTVENCINASADIPDGHGAGLAHAYSGTCAIDIDDMFAASLLFAERGLNLNDFLNAPDAVQIVSGRPGSGKLIYRTWMPFASKKINLNGKTALEFRCATANSLTVQDLLPPSLHPSGTTYQWAGKGRWQDLPQLPAPLMAWWMELLTVVEPSAPAVEPIDYNMGEITSALNAIDSDCDRQVWIECLMGLKYTNDPEAYSIGKEWSEKGHKWPGDREFAHQWKSLKNDHPKPITPAAIYHHAKAAGWKPPPPDVSALFTNVEPDDIDEIIITGNPIPNVHAEFLPDTLRDYAEEVGQTMGASVVIPALAGLIAVSAAVDARSRLTVKAGMEVPPVLWGMTVASPSAKKTPASDPMFAPLTAIEREDQPRYQAELLAWKAREAAHISGMKAYTAAAADASWLLAGADVSSLPVVPVLPPQPVPLRFRTQDSTSQKLAYLCAERPEGMACIMDEAAGWLNRVTAANSGDNRSTWTCSYDSKPHYFDRVGTGSLYIENLAVPIYCNVQPNVISKYMSGNQDAQDDGFLQRFIPGLVPDGEASRVGTGRPDYLSYKHQWEQVIRQAYSATKGGKAYMLDHKGQELFHQYEHWLENLKQEERLINSDANLQSAFGKLFGLTGRIAMVFHIMEKPSIATVEVDTVERAIAWVKSYVIPALRHFYAMGDKQDSIDKWLAEYILTAPESVLSISDLQRSARRIIERLKLSSWQAQTAVESCLITLSKAGWTTALPFGHGEKSQRYAINPQLRIRYSAKRQHIAQIKQARIEQVREITRKAIGREPAERFARGLQRSA
jgi:hypothetical protein